MSWLTHPQGNIRILYDGSEYTQIRNLKYDSYYRKHTENAKDIWVGNDRRLTMQQIIYECQNNKIIDWSRESLSYNSKHLNKELKLISEPRLFCRNSIVNAYACLFDSLKFELKNLKDNSFMIDSYFIYFGSMRRPRNVESIRIVIGPSDKEFGLFEDGSRAYIEKRMVEGKEYYSISASSINSIKPKISIEANIRIPSIHIPELLYDERLKIGRYKREYIDLNSDTCLIDERTHLSAYVMNIALAYVHTKSFFKVGDGSWKTKYVYDPKRNIIIHNELSYEYDNCEFISFEVWNELWDERTAELERKLNTVIDFYKRLNQQNKDRVLSGADIDELLIREEHAIEDMHSILSQINASNYNTGLHQNILRLLLTNEFDKKIDDSGRNIAIKISHATRENFKGDYRLVLLSIPIGSYDIRKRLVKEYYPKLEFISSNKGNYIVLPIDKVEELLDKTIEFINSIGIQSNPHVAKNLEAIALYREMMHPKSSDS